MLGDFDIIVQGMIKMRYLNFGSLNIDKIYEVAHFVKAGETISSHHYKELDGGKA